MYFPPCYAFKSFISCNVVPGSAIYSENLYIHNSRWHIEHPSSSKIEYNFSFLEKYFLTKYLVISKSDVNI